MTAEYAADITQSYVPGNACFELQLALFCTHHMWGAEPGPLVNFNDVLILGGGNRF